MSWQICLIADVPNAALDKLKPILKADDAILDTPATAAAIVKARETLGISQKALALELSVSQSYLCDLEKGSRRWSLALFNSAKAALEKLSK